MKRMIIVALVPLAIFTISGLFVVRSYSRAIVQPIAFNHAKHLEQGVECFGCHATVRTSAIAGKPRIETCMLCHETPLGQTAEEEKVREYAARKEEIPWRRLYRLPEHVFFPHEVHVVSAQIECKTCHGAIAESSAPPRTALVTFTMNDCLACHRSMKASTDCIACHR